MLFFFRLSFFGNISLTIKLTRNKNVTPAKFRNTKLYLVPMLHSSPPIAGPNDLASAPRLCPKPFTAPRYSSVTEWLTIIILDVKHIQEITFRIVLVIISSIQ